MLKVNSLGIQLTACSRWYSWRLDEYVQSSRNWWYQTSPIYPGSTDTKIFYRGWRREAPQGKDHFPGILPVDNIAQQILWDLSELNFIRKILSVDCRACKRTSFLDNHISFCTNALILFAPQSYCWRFPALYRYFHWWIMRLDSYRYLANGQPKLCSL